MLNKNNIRELCYITKINDIKPIEGKDRVECAVVGGWTIMVRKDQFKIGDLGIYFEIDSKVPETEPFKFLEEKHYKIKTQKYGKFYSQGLLMSAEDFGGFQYQDGDGQYYLHFGKDSFLKENIDLAEGEFLTEKLGVTYYEPEDNKRKAKVNPDAKINAALSRHPKIARKYGRFIKKHKWARALFIFFFGKKKDVRNWPAWVVKTDEERVQNMPWILEDKSEWYATEKIDGTSTTFTMRGRGRKQEFYVCSRNVVFDTPDKGCFYDTNVYLEMAEKYNVKEVLQSLMNIDNTLEFVTIQGETYGEGIQKRDYSLKEHRLMAFNLIFGYKDGRKERLNPREMTDMLTPYGIPCVPIVDEHFILPDTVDELLTIATDKSAVDGGMREGLVFRSQDGTKSFKAVSNEFLVKYHQ